MPTTTIDRATLYAQVWETPLSRLAPTYGITDVALEKACARLGVPAPRLLGQAPARARCPAPAPPLACTRRPDVVHSQGPWAGSRTSP